jgi:tRNA G18 (ribose-2'-O)-methylase SpoU
VATDRVTIPMQLGTDSLNVSVAAAIFMYELAARHR